MRLGRFNIAVFFFFIAEIENKNLENGEKISNMLVNSSSERKEKKVVNKSKYPRNERVRVS